MWSRFNNAVKVKDSEHEDGPKTDKWTNVDLAPNPPETRRWDSWSFFLFQFSS